jgi:ubiquinone/menaquinone biosynthesis C-methylase UbiE
MRRVFGELAPNYLDTMERELQATFGFGVQALASRLIQMIPIRGGETVLDIATGSAFIPLKLTQVLGPKGRIIGLDITPDMLKHGNDALALTEASQRIRLVCASGTAMPFGRGVFDAVLCGFGSHHMPLSQLLTEIHRVLREGGVLALMEAGAPAYWRSWGARTVLEVALRVYGTAGKHARAQVEAAAVAKIQTAGEWRAKLLRAGFVQIEILECRGRHPWHPHALTIRAVAGTD